jgi:chitinase
MRATGGSGPGAPPDDDQPAGRRLSWARLAVLVVALTVVAAGTFVAVTRVDGWATTTPTGTSWSVPYVDVTVTPTFQFQDPASNPARTVALSFVVADPTSDCTPSWGGAYSLDAAASDLELDRRIAQLRASGGDVVVSLGGQANTELAVACDDTDALTTAYRDVVERYHLSTIDLDIEGTALADQAAAIRRAEALSSLQRERTAAGHPLAVWLTLPAVPGGLTPEGQDLVRTTLAEGVALTGVNVMTMDYGSAKPATQSMIAAAEQAIRSTVAQVRTLWAQHGKPLNEAEGWAHVGATPMIGQNDVPGEVFTTADAQQLASFARANGLGRVSLWSLNRDAACKATFAGVVVQSATCSGVSQKALAFVNTFTDLGSSGSAVPSERVIHAAPSTTVVDDPATSRYPIWRPEGQYPAGYRVVWHGQVYQARWYSVGTDPSLGTTSVPAFPWALLGAVAKTDVAPKLVPTVDDVTIPWDPQTLYQRGDRVLLNGLPYEARWTTRDEAPGVLLPIGPNAAWKPLFTVPGEPPGS